MKVEAIYLNEVWENMVCNIDKAELNTIDESASKTKFETLVTDLIHTEHKDVDVQITWKHEINTTANVVFDSMDNYLEKEAIEIDIVRCSDFIFGKGEFWVNKEKMNIEIKTAEHPEPQLTKMNWVEIWKHADPDMGDIESGASDDCQEAFYAGGKVNLSESVWVRLIKQ